MIAPEDIMSLAITWMLQKKSSLLRLDWKCSQIRREERETIVKEMRPTGLRKYTLRGKRQTNYPSHCDYYSLWLLFVIINCLDTFLYYSNKQSFCKVPGSEIFFQIIALC